MHNMIVKGEGEDGVVTLEFKNVGGHIKNPEQNPATFDDFVQMHQQIQNRATHEQLKKDSVDHLWVVKGDN